MNAAVLTIALLLAGAAQAGNLPPQKQATVSTATRTITAPRCTSQLSCPAPGNPKAEVKN